MRVGSIIRLVDGYTTGVVTHVSGYGYTILCGFGELFVVPAQVKEVVSEGG